MTGLSSHACRPLSRLPRVLALALGWLVFAACSRVAHAGVTPLTSRVVFPAGVTEQSLQLVNVNPYPVLVQAWVDDGDVNAVPQQSTSPIIALPPIFRMGPTDRTSLRLIHSGKALPTDRESLFWLNLHEIPPTKSDPPSDGQTVTVTMRTQIKVFVRPEKLPMPVSELPQRLAFSIRKESAMFCLTIENPTPYFATINALAVTVGDETQEITVDMIAPQSRAERDFAFGHAIQGAAATIAFSLLDDDGNPVLGERK